MENSQVMVYLHDGSPKGSGTLEVHHSDSVLTFRNDFWVSNGVQRIGEVLFTRYMNDNQAMYVMTQEVGRVLQQTIDQRR